MMSTISHFLSGIRIVDFSQYIPDPLSTLMLADMGANVIEIEPPSGDPMRTLGPLDRAGGPLFYETLNAGKSVHCFDLKDPTDRNACVDLIRICDVLLEGFRPGVMQPFGLDLFSSDDCCVSPVLPIDKAIQSQHVKSRGLARR